MTIVEAEPNDSWLTDSQLAAACARGETSAFETLYRTHGGRMKSIAYNHLGNRAEAEEAVQEVFLKVHRTASTFTGEASFSTWLYRILVNTCLDILRKRLRRPRETALEEIVGAGPEHRAGDDVALKMTLRKLIDDLPPQKRTVFLLFEVEGLSHAEIAEILGTTAGSSKWLLFEAKKQIRSQWKTRS